jgi:hypothetical protein
MADEDKLVKAGVEAALKPFSELLEKLAGPAAEEIGLTLKDHVRVFRFKRQLRLFERVKEILAESRIEPGRVPLRLLLPMVENASIEEDDDLQDRWAAMLANAAAGGNGGSGVEPVFPLILKELGIQEVRFLDELYNEAMRKHVKRRAELPAFINFRSSFNIYDLKNVYLQAASRKLPMDANQQQEFRLSFDIVMRNRLLDELYDLVDNRDEQRQEVGSIYRLSALGVRFIRACRTPKAGEPELDGSGNLV